MTEGATEFSDEEQKRVRHAMGLIMECMKLNEIKCADGVHAMVNIIASQMQEDCKEKFINVLQEMVNDH